MRRSGLVAVCITGALLLSAARAQEPLRSTSRHAGAVELLAVKGKPFSATTTTEWTRSAEDKGALRLTAKLARDGQGRIYRERYAFVPSEDNTKLVPNEIQITDPVSQSQAFCSTRAMECVLTEYQPKTSLEPPKNSAEDNGVRTFKRESIGSEVMEGLRVTGTRETTTLKTAILGNGTPFVSMREFWFSEDLMTNLAVTRTDARRGKLVIRLSQIKRGEPDAHLFEVPAGYQVRDVRRKHARNPGN